MALHSDSHYNGIEGDELKKSLIEDIHIDVKGFNETKSIMFGLLTALFFSLHNFTIGNLSQNGYMARMVTGIGMMIPAIIYYGRKWIISYKAGEKFFTIENSVFRNPYSEKFEKWILAGVIFSVVLIIIGGINVIYSFKFALDSNMNQGIITSIYGLTPFVVAVLFYIFFKECLKVSQVIGMLFMVTCIVLIGFGVKDHKNLTANIEEENNITKSAYIAIILSVICPFFFATSGLVVRLLKNKYNIDAYEFTQTYYIFQGCLLLIVTPIVYNLSNFHFTVWDFLQLLLAGVLSSTGGTFLNMAITCGNAGVAYSLINAQVIFFTILATIFLQQIPSSIEILAAAIGILGSCIMSVGPDIYEKIRDWAISKLVDN